MKQHLKTAWDHVPHPIQRILTSGAVGFVIAVATTMFSDVMKQFPGAQTPPMPGAPPPPRPPYSGYQSGNNRQSGYWKAEQQRRSHGHHHHWKGRS